MTTGTVATLRMTYPVMSVPFQCDAISARRGRKLVRRAVESWDTGLDSEQHDVLELLTSELITNCVLHAASDYNHVTMQQDRWGVRVTVTDTGRELPLLVRRENPAALGGRGLTLVDALADDWGVADFPNGKAVWFRLHTR